MNVNHFRAVFERYFPPREHALVATHLEDAFTRSHFDPCFDVEGMASLKKLKLLNIGYALLPETEAYLELGTYQGKSLVSAMAGNPRRAAFACDNFSEFTGSNSLATLERNLATHGLLDAVRIFDEAFQSAFARPEIDVPVGLYFDDGPHDEVSQYQAIALAERFLADEALVVVDDWRLAADSQSYAKAGTVRAVAESRHRWTLLYELPARYNGDQGLWWNGVGVYGFQRR